MATIYDSKKLVESSFSSSRVISLDNLSLICDKETLQGIRSEVSDNMELYYNDDISDYFLSIRMEEILKDREYKYNSPMVLRKKEMISKRDFSLFCVIILTGDRNETCSCKMSFMWG